MTVCIAAICVGTNPDQSVGRSVIVASDRMMTAGDTEYEPPRVKICFLRKNILILVAGEFPAHTEAISRVSEAFSADQSPSGIDIASRYGRHIADFKRRRAEHVFLSPFGLTMDTFLLRQSSMGGNIVNDLHFQIQNHNLEVEAVVASVDGEAANIYHIDQDGFVTTHNDSGFVSIGIGRSHASSQFMQLGYTNTWPFVAALSLVHLAKKTAEVAPGVGRATDIYVISKDGSRPIEPEIASQLESLYIKYTEENGKLRAGIVAELNAFVESEGAKRRANTAGEAGTGDAERG